MAVVPITFGPGGIREVGDHRVYTRIHWRDTWQRQDYMQCLEAVWACAPTLPTATLLWRYGKLSQIDLPGFIWYAKKNNVTRLFVKVEIDTNRHLPSDPPDPNDPAWDTKKWYGVIELNDDALWGARMAGGAFASGEQTFTAYGLEKLLADHWILSSWWDDAGVAIETARAITFNYDGRGNRTIAKVDDSHIFEPDPDSGQPWSSLNIVEYLLATQTPRDNLGAVKVPFSINTNSDVPTWDRPEVSQEGQTCYSLIERIVNRKRLLLWWLEVEADADPANPDNVVLKTNTMVDKPLTLTLPGSPTITENDTQLRLLFNDDQLTVAALRADGVQQYDQVICYGARRRSVGSISVMDATLEKGWDVAIDEHAYEVAASAATAYAGLSVKEKQKRNCDARNAPKLEKVYCFFRIPNTWDRIVKDGEAGDPHPLFPDDLGSVTGEPIYFPALAIEQSLPLIVGIDYSGDQVANGTLNEPTRDREELSPLVFFKRPETANEPDRGWVNGETLADTIDLEEADEDANNRWSVSVRVPKDSRGLYIRVHGGPGQHVIATADFTKLPVDEHPGGYRYDTGMIVTISLEDDRHVEGRWPATEPANIDAIRRLRLDCGDGYRKDYVAPGTVVGVAADGKLLRSTGGHIPKISTSDDKAQLTALAQVAAAWYCVLHQVLHLETRRLRIDIGLGNLVAEIGDPASPTGHRHVINSPVTEIAIAIPKDGGDPTMGVTTWAGELDPMELMPRLPNRPIGSWESDVPGGTALPPSPGAVYLGSGEWGGK